jgi:enoyl-CoA hydratase/carnithine racemase
MTMITATQTVTTRSHTRGDASDPMGSATRLRTLHAVADLEYSVDGNVATITINRPDARNSMSSEVIKGLHESIALARSDENVRVVVLTGAGERAFCAGADLTGMVGSSAIEAHDSRGLLADVFRELWSLGKPTIARVRGYALAGGFGLAMACDFVIASDDAQFGTPEINVGLWPFMITVPLLRSMPPRLVLELMATGRRVPAEEAARLGIVTRVVEADKLDEAVADLARTLAEKSPLIMRLGRDSFYRALEMRSDDALDYLQSMLTLTTLSDDTKEGLAAFVEKRTPQWRGR